MSAKKSGSNKNTKKDRKSSTTTGDSASIREFLYLDYPKLTSYFAQFNRGLLSEKTRRRGTRLEKGATTPSVENGFEGSFRLGTNEEPSMAQLLGLVADLHAKVSRVTTSGGDSTQRSDEDVIIEEKTLHHDMFNHVEQHLAKNELIDDTARRRIGTRPFTCVSGPCEIIDFDAFTDFIADHDKLRSSMKAITGKEIDPIVNAKSLLYLMDRFYKNRVGVLITTETGTVSALLDKEQLTASTQTLIDNYGRQTHVNVTLLGVKADVSGRATRETSAGDRDNGMTGALLKLNSALEGVDAAVRLRGDAHLYPLALYIDFSAHD